MKIYFERYNGEIVGAQIVNRRGGKFTISTNGAKCGLWIGDKQVIGTCDFDLCCSSSTARKRLIEQAIFRCSSEDVEEDVEIARKPIF